MKRIVRQATVKGNRVIATMKTDGTWTVDFIDRGSAYRGMSARNVSEVGLIAHEMADNNDIGRELDIAIKRKLWDALDKM